MTTRPSTFPDWATNNPNGVVVPSSADQATGWTPNEPPPAEYANWLANTTSRWLRYLDAQGSSTVLASSLDFSTRLVGGGTWSLTGTTLAWSATAFIAIPSATDASNTIAAGSVTLPSGSLAYVTANMPFSTTASTTSGSTQLANVIYGDMATVGQLVTGTGIPANTTVQAVSSDGQTITLSSAATATASNVSVTFSSSGTLTVGVAASATFVPGPNTVVFARGLDTTCIVGVGTGQMLLRKGELKTLLGSGFAFSSTYNAGFAIDANVPVYVSQGHGSQSVGDGIDRFFGSVYPSDASVRYDLEGSGNLDFQRAKFVGMTTHAAAANSPVEVVQIGRLGGFQFLRPGERYYVSPTGGITLNAPTTTNQTVLFVGLAIDQSTLFVCAGHAPMKVNAPPVYRTVLPMGGAYASGAGLGGFFGTTYYMFPNQGTPSQFTTVPYQWTADRPGSVVGISYDYSNSTAFSQGAAILQINGARVNAGSTGSQSSSTYSTTFAKGALPFNAGDRLSTYAGISSANPNGATVSGTVALVLAFDP